VFVVLFVLVVPKKSTTEKIDILFFTLGAMQISPQRLGKVGNSLDSDKLSLLPEQDPDLLI